MIGNLEPEERVYDCAVQAQGKWLGELAIALESLGWDRGDNVAVEIAGTSVYEIDGAGTKWAPVKGTRKYNKDAFIIISNQSRRDLTGSQPMDREHKPAHPYEPKKEVKKDAT